MKATESPGRPTAACQPYLLVPGRLVRAVVSQRAGGLLIVVNMNPDQKCNFDCRYCEVHRSTEYAGQKMDVGLMSGELEQMLSRVHEGRGPPIEERTGAPHELMRLRAVALSGDGEPTLCPAFLEVVRQIAAIRESGRFPWFKLILVTNASGLDRPAVRQALELFDDADEVWAKLETGTEAGMRSINKTRVSFGKILRNIRSLGQRRSVIIQSLFCELDGVPPADAEIREYIRQLDALRREGTRIDCVQIYSVSRPPARPGCGHLPLARLAEIARRVHDATGLETEVF